MKTALDSNILSSLWSAEKSAEQIRQNLVDARARGSIVLCAPVYVELAAHPLVTPGMVDRLLKEADITIEFVLDESVWRKAAERFAAYAHRRRTSTGGLPKRLLPDFLIAAHALMNADRLFTLDASRYQQDFPELALV
ncbi:MAG TPA: type II toxin-antitoxin system VapC family toxin [Candidatus Sulfotelmatobacter sp.]|nr:type II toxin-antitoxin system VapC family toxin [Candidatus Sulfotelmatobacter sp.]